MKVIVSGGGTGGHIFPAIAIANAVKNRYSDAEILFVGAEGRMEMEKVPAAGYTIKGLPIAGLQRKLTIGNIIKNLQLPFKMAMSRIMVKKIIRSFQPDIVVGVGGFASEPTLKAAAAMGYPTLLQEQNSYAGLTNKMLSKSATTICVAYDGMERFFPKEKIVFTGNPVRSSIEDMDVTKEQGRANFELRNDSRVILIIGGSLGARSINQMMLKSLPMVDDLFVKNNIQVVWQTGSYMYDEAVDAVVKANAGETIKVHKFISQMDMAYAAADIIISRAGAIAISELCIVGKPIILIPSPNVAEDHQTKNALALVEKGAALMVRDNECGDTGLQTAIDLMGDTGQQSEMSKNILNLARRKAADRIVDEIEKILTKK